MDKIISLRGVNPDRKITECTCVVCGRTFQSNKAGTMYCSTSCYYKAYRQDHQEEEPKEVQTLEPCVAPIEEQPEQDQENNQPPFRDFNPDRQTFQRTCVVCGREYTTNNRHSIYCSQACQQRKWREDKKAEAEAFENKYNQLANDHLATSDELDTTNRELIETVLKLNKANQGIENANRKLEITKKSLADTRKQLSDYRNQSYRYESLKANTTRLIEKIEKMTIEGDDFFDLYLKWVKESLMP